MVEAHLSGPQHIRLRGWGRVVGGESGVKWLIRGLSAEEGPPEASFGCVVVQGGGDGGEDEACRALCPGEPRAGSASEKACIARGGSRSRRCRGRRQGLWPRGRGARVASISWRAGPSTRRSRRLRGVPRHSGCAVRACRGAGADRLLDHEHRPLRLGSPSGAGWPVSLIILDRRESS